MHIINNCPHKCVEEIKSNCIVCLDCNEIVNIYDIIDVSPYDYEE
jgi:hypothetical protein